MSSIYRQQVPVALTLTTLILVIVGLSRNVDAGKGKVPIYMPIPIPIPMPMGPSHGGGSGSGGGGGKYHHHQHSDSGEGEVKKIYLLQPISRAHPQPQLKGGGYMGAPVQTHIHMAPPVLQHPNKMRQHNSAGYSSISSKGTSENDGYNLQPPPSEHTKSSDVKILPIVVIPPIAPMPQIQISTNDLHRPRMSLTPQFNNYVVSPASSSSSSSRRFPYTSSQMTLLHDQKSFADFGYPAGSRLRGRHSRLASSSGGGGGGGYAPESYTGSARLGGGSGISRGLRSYDSYGDNAVDSDYDSVIGPSSSLWRQRPLYGSDSGRSGRRHFGTLAGNGLTQRRYRGDSGFVRSHQSLSGGKNSIRDIMDQQALFDDDYDAGGGGSMGPFEASELRESLSSPPSSSSSYSLSSSLRDCCSERHSNAPIKRPNYSDEDINPMATSNFEGQKETHARGGLIVDQRQSMRQRQRNLETQSQVSRDVNSNFNGDISVIKDELTINQADGGQLNQLDRDRSLGSQTTLRTRDPLNSVYYEREPLIDGLPSMKGKYINENQSPQKSYFDDDRTNLNDDEWRFDTIKSVVYVNPTQTNSTTTLTSTTTKDFVTTKMNSTTSMTAATIENHYPVAPK